MSRKFTHEQKLQYLRDGYEFVHPGKDSYKTYIAEIGVSRGLCYQWVSKHADEAGIQVRGRNQSLVPIGKPKGHHRL